MRKECCSEHPVWKWVLGIFFFLVAIFVVFSIASMIVFKFQRFEGRSDVNKLMMGNVTSLCQRDGKCDCGGTGMVKGWGKSDDRSDVVRVYGTISKVEGNLITIMNNGAKEQIVVSAVDTVIMSSSTEVGLSALKVGGGAVFVGSMNAETQLVAKLIQLQ